jgi:hypothetical protein
MRRWLVLGARAGLSTSNPNISKAEIRIEICIYRWKNYPCLDVPEDDHLINCSKNWSLQNSYLAQNSTKKRFRRNWRSELTIRSEQFCLQFLSKAVPFFFLTRQWRNYLVFCPNSATIFLHRRIYSLWFFKTFFLRKVTAHVASILSRSRKRSFEKKKIVCNVPHVRL